MVQVEVCPQYYETSAKSGIQSRDFYRPTICEFLTIWLAHIKREHPQGFGVNRRDPVGIIEI